ncbi:uncharacterized protein LOC132061973 [Lycium ferocissimum]|uniref:uncharacterized protein LOC132061973 n=1 Tax=Lycium ferocissimum TaxID=112874 RepID=UPI002815C33A|nr:uncharacterized protein LOC132061973 [Lycium ferocissimum]
MMDHSLLDSSLIEEEKGLRGLLEKWGGIEESIYKQKSRIQWLKVGDSNSKYFYASMKNRHSHNNIRQLMDAAGVMLFDEVGIKNNILRFYKALLGSSTSPLPAIYPQIISNGRLLTRKHQVELIKPITKAEVYDALQSIDDGKAPGCDRLNSCFFKKAWPIIGGEITEAILHFFRSFSMAHAINCTSVTLIPKVQNPASVKDYTNLLLGVPVAEQQLILEYLGISQGVYDEILPEYLLLAKRHLFYAMSFAGKDGGKNNYLDISVSIICGEVAIN